MDAISVDGETVTVHKTHSMPMQDLKVDGEVLTFKADSPHNSGWTVYQFKLIGGNEAELDTLRTFIKGHGILDRSTGEKRPRKMTRVE